MGGTSEEITQTALIEAAEWLVRLQSGTADAVCLQTWISARPENARAWQRMSQFEQGIVEVPPERRELAKRALDSVRAQRSKRKTLSILAALALGGGSTWGFFRTPAGGRLLADHATGIGERLTRALPRGGELRLNTDTIVMESDHARLKLTRGEIYVDTAGEAILIDTAYGALQPVGTRFTVRDLGDATRVSVIDGLVRATPTNSSSSVDVSAGETFRFDRNRAAADPVVSQLSPTAWLDGLIDARSVRLGDLAAELARYQSGHIHIASDAADLIVSGVFRLNAVDEAWLALEASLPISVQRYTPFLTVIQRI